MTDTLFARARQRLAVLLPLEPLLYGLWAATFTLLCACRFYSSMRLQTAYADLFADERAFSRALEGALGPWSAPLDDVFIHFDFARQSARGHAFEWSPGAGYSSGGTSLLYPFVLVPGLWLGLTGLNLMQWAAVVACVCVFGTLLSLRRLFRNLPRATSYLLPPVFLCVGALNWSLWSGMEVALFLGLWSLTIVAWDDLCLAATQERTPLAAATLLGLSGLLTCATRPEGIGALFVLTATALWAHRRRAPVQLLFLLALALTPGCAVLVTHGLANRMLTGDSTAAGALVKLEMHHPYLTRSEVIGAWWFHFKYQVLRVTQYHFSDIPWIGWFAWVIAAYALVARSTRKVALVLWLSLLTWVSIVALNGQVRWQNERYTMPAVAWLLTSAALGLAAAAAQLDRRRWRSLAPALCGLVLASVFVWRQAPRYREQLWFFGRASRNIYDQHVRTGRKLRDEFRPQPTRVLVGDAGAIPYISDLPALDIIGLGGFHGLPFARATRQNVAAGIELIERLKPSERPDVLAIYPGWWGDFPLWFGRRLDAVPVRGNVICGGANKVLYQPRWESLNRSEQPFTLAPGERSVDGVDMADLVSEKEHGYALSNGSTGHVLMKLLPNPKFSREDLWDAGRIVPPGVRESFTLSGLDPERPVTLIVRAAPTEATTLQLEADPNVEKQVELARRDGWLEQRIELGTPGVSRLSVRLSAERVERVLFHVWAVQPE
ncbi:MAG TPA: hypothetical protein VHP33_28470 [Polyangiaceae bacterium]|nr:hypothetical protein [Polyangiaceae bacterium]